MEKLSTIACDPVCGFSVSSHDTKEAMSIAKSHAKDKHNMSMSDADIKKMMK